MYTRLLNLPLNNSFFLFGARGTGKTALLERTFENKNVLWINLLKGGEFLEYSAKPSRIADKVASFPNLEWVVIDEVQRVPELLNEAHALIEERKLKFALTGSSARKLKRGNANLLAGRARLNHLYPLCSTELGADFNLEDALRWGGLPGAVNEKTEEGKRDFLESYVEVYLREEIREEQIIRRLDPFARFLEAAAQSSGTIINHSKIAREASSDARSIIRYFHILEETLLGFYLEPYHASIRKRQRQQAKFYLFDIGVKRALEKSLRVPVIPGTFEYGKLFEHFLVLEIMSKNSYSKSGFKFSFLRSGGDLEIDLIAERKGSLTWAIEIKSGKIVSEIEIGKLKRLSADIPNSKPVVFYDGRERLVIEGVTIYPWHQGIHELLNNR